MNIWFVADTHFLHSNILKYTNRPFENVAQMDVALINNWNSVIGENDHVYHLGDFAFARTFDELKKIRDQLNGKIHFITGNHDDFIVKNIGLCRKLFDTIHISYREIRIDGHHLTLCHYPMRRWNKSHYGSYHLYGHVHNQDVENIDNLRMLNVGIDVHNCMPISFDYIHNYMQTINYKENVDGKRKW